MMSSYCPLLNLLDNCLKYSSLSDIGTKLTVILLSPNSAACAAEYSSAHLSQIARLVMTSALLQKINTLSV